MSPFPINTSIVSFNNFINNVMQFTIIAHSLCTCGMSKKITEQLARIVKNLNRIIAQIFSFLFFYLTLFENFQPRFESTHQALQYQGRHLTIPLAAQQSYVDFHSARRSTN